MAKRLSGLARRELIVAVRGLATIHILLCIAYIFLLPRHYRAAHSTTKAHNATVLLTGISSGLGSFQRMRALRRFIHQPMRACSLKKPPACSCRYNTCHSINCQDHFADVQATLQMRMCGGGLA